MNNVNKVLALIAVITSFAPAVSMDTKSMLPKWWHNSQTKKMVAYCEAKCKGEICTKKCIRDYSEQIEHFLVIAATNKCQGNNNLNLKKFEYVSPENPEAGCEMLRKTIDAYANWKDPKIKECASRLMEAETKFIQRELLRPKLAEVEQCEKEHPLLTKAVKFKKRVESFWDNGD